MVEPGPADERRPQPRHRVMAQHVDARIEVEERSWHHQVGEDVVDHAHGHAPVDGPGQGLDEAASDPVALPDVGLEQYPVPGGVDGGDHVVEQVAALGVDGDVAEVAQGHIDGWFAGEGHVPALVPAVVVDDGEADDGGRLRREEHSDAVLDRSAHPPPECHAPTLRGTRRRLGGP